MFKNVLKEYEKVKSLFYDIKDDLLKYCPKDNKPFKVKLKKFLLILNNVFDMEVYPSKNDFLIGCANYFDMKNTECIGKRVFSKEFDLSKSSQHINNKSICFSPSVNNDSQFGNECKSNNDCDFSNIFEQESDCEIVSDDVDSSDEYEYLSDDAIDNNYDDIITIDLTKTGIKSQNVVNRKPYIIFENDTDNKNNDILSKKFIAPTMFKLDTDIDVQNKFSFIKSAGDNEATKIYGSCTTIGLEHSLYDDSVMRVTSMISEKQFLLASTVDLKEVFDKELPENVTSITKEMMESALHKVPYIMERKVSCKNLFCADKYDLSTDVKFLDYNSKYKRVKTIDFCDMFFNLQIVDTSYMFYGCGELISLDFSSFNTSDVTNMRHMFEKCSKLESINFENIDTSNVSNMSFMFKDCSHITHLDLSMFDTINVTDMRDMFNKCSKLISIDLSSFDTKNVTNMSNMFSSCFKMNSVNLASFNTSKVIDMSGMFAGCFNITSLDLSMFNTSKVRNMSFMFYLCSNLSRLNIDSFDTSNVVIMSDIFTNCSCGSDFNIKRLFNTKKYFSI